MKTIKLAQWDEVDLEVTEVDVPVSVTQFIPEAILEHIDQVDASLNVSTGRLEFNVIPLVDDTLTVVDGTFGQDKKYMMFYHPDIDVAKTVAKLEMEKWLGRDE